jgi:acyl-CoA thioesterase
VNSIAKMSAQGIAEAAVKSLWNDDPASQHLGMKIDQVSPGHAVVTMAVGAQMVNGHGTCHGGYIFILADSAFAFASNGYNQRSVGQHCSITYLHPGHIGDQLTAEAHEVSRQGRSGLYDVRVINQDGIHIAELRGISHTVKGTHLPVEN